MPHPFDRFELRTTEVDGAREFYRAILGDGFASPALAIVPLPEPAAARGAPPHWLGHLSVDDVDRTAGRMIEAGAERKGPPGGRAILRDPFGAMVALEPGGARVEISPVAHHLHHSDDEIRSFDWYSRLFGWTVTGTLDLGPTLGRHRMFAWDAGGPTVGSATNLARLPYIHPQWMFYFPVEDMDRTLDRVRARNGKAIGPMRLSTGDLAAACDDPQGGAFGLYQFTHHAS